MLAQIPGGRIDVALDSKTAEDRIHADRRTSLWWCWSGGGTLEFADGRLASYSLDHERKSWPVCTGTGRRVILAG